MRIAILLAVAAMVACERQAAPIEALELIAHPKKFDGQKVVAHGIWATAMEHSVLRASRAKSDTDYDFSIWVGSAPESMETLRAQLKEAWGNRARSSREFGYEESEIVAEGIFRTSPDIPIFGHLGGCRSEFTITRLLSIRYLD